ncbi:MAG: hypothetical protein GWN67_00365 [Phycisphaerae bacterium]|nr:hypothetical protein [Phycisphaerae bacterium]NIP50438.1 hypothetical protein [Phycisphaerae bacterium]NIS49566.1 hypothetical protein [Phycisphaerae bacterium]NIU07324.1 hypothetical protein [Phycisphaerae bacterium]NIU54893.1 hypothetical protein [Phycisphaerae bacterium]
MQASDISTNARGSTFGVAFHNAVGRFEPDASPDVGLASCVFALRYVSDLGGHSVL